MARVPVLEIGGTHVAVAMVDLATRAVNGIVRIPVDNQAAAATILDTFASAARCLDAPPGAVWGVAMPGPFDYLKGIALFQNVGKYESLYGLDVGAELAIRLDTGSGAIGFVNDADAFTLGEGLLRDIPHLVGITLGTGVGSGWVIDGHHSWDAPGVPPEGRINPNVDVRGRHLEDFFSTRAIRARHRELGGPDLEVRAITDAARAGDATALTTLREATAVLGEVLGPRIREFGAELLVLGGSITGSWDLLEPWFLEAAGDLPPIALSGSTERSSMLGAALAAAL